MVIGRILAFILVLAVCPAASAGADAERVTLPADPIAAVTRPAAWLNTARPLTPEDLRGRMILLDFRDGFCIACLQAMPDITALEEAYGAELTVIGVHSARSGKAQDMEAVRQTVLHHGIRGPVVHDADFSLRDAFHIRAWPAYVLISPQGAVEGRYPGEESVEALKRDIERIRKRSQVRPRADALPLRPEPRQEDAGLLRFPAKIAYIPEYRGRPALAVADSGLNRILIAATDGNVLDVIGSGQKGRQDGLFDVARFSMPQGLLAQGGLLYIADAGNHQLRLADLATRQVSTLAGDGRKAGPDGRRDAPALQTALASPWDLAFFPDEAHIAIAMAGRHQLWSYDIVGRTLSVLAGTGAQGQQDGAAGEALLAQPSGLSAAGKSLYFVEAQTGALRVLAGGQVKTLTGGGRPDSSMRAGPRATAPMPYPPGLAATGAGIFIADTLHHAIRRYDPQTGKLKHYAGTGSRGDQNGAAARAGFSAPGGLAAAEKTLYVADTHNRSIRRVDMDKAQVSLLALREEPQVMQVTLQAQLPNPLPFGQDRLLLAHHAPVSLTLGLAPGWHIHKDAPSYLALFDLVQGNRAVAQFDRTALRQNRMVIPPRTGVMYRLQGTLYYCEDRPGALCLLRSVDIPVGFERGGIQDYRIALH